MFGVCSQIIGRVDEKASQLHAIASLKALLDAAKTDATTTMDNNRTKPIPPDGNPSSIQPADGGVISNMEGGENGENGVGVGEAPTVQVCSKTFLFLIRLLY